ncbi:hypothetical protein BO83DRAFT_404166 [Aspergillus eucalypticola CBS 122712]|uniref:Uncharacterized protein n=1 Tax=Aspergillus eucalypticola (strain CBS 122712 / IBT 29274) TaxID=1448314 RepID=A0A317UN60_ASPEC|nr:uncharacterized protein BO83DRAFT_404166 [Aspergillus eucalypticola CBS 122712]PWY62007.1 hypothetical protein BO83DRAFT_404166 [Aspergillus eucalypticola CBS 122712]
MRLPRGTGEVEPATSDGFERVGESVGIGEGRGVTRIPSRNALKRANQVEASRGQGTISTACNFEDSALKLLWD